MRRSAQYDHPMDVARPFLLVGAAFFAAGFYGYFAVSALFAG